MRMQHRLLLAGLASLGLLAGCGERPPVQTVQVGYRGTGMEQNYNPRLLQNVAAANQIGSIQPAAAPVPLMAKDQYPGIEVLDDLTLTEFTRVMQSMSEWVAPKDQQCTYCHVGENFADASKYQYKVARSMLRMTREINSKWKDHVKDTGVTCHTCHRGNAVPQYTWYTDPGPRVELASIGSNAGQNTPVTALGTTTIAHSSLPYDPYSPFLLGDGNIRVETTSALPAGNRASIQQAEGFLDEINGGRRDSRALHAHNIDGLQLRIVTACRQHEGRNIVGNAAATADKAQPAKSGEVVHHRISGNNRTVMHMHMSTQQHTIHKDHVVGDVAVVGHMAVRHEHVVIADPSDSVFLLGAAIHGHAFPENVVVTNSDLSLRILPADVLWIAANDAVRGKAVLHSDPCLAGQYNMTRQDRLVTDLHIGTNETEGANLYPLPDFCSRVNL